MKKTIIYNMIFVLESIKGQIYCQLLRVVTKSGQQETKDKVSKSQELKDCFVLFSHFHKCVTIVSKVFYTNNAHTQRCIYTWLTFTNQDEKTTITRSATLFVPAVMVTIF